MYDKDIKICLIYTNTTQPNEGVLPSQHDYACLQSVNTTCYINNALQSRIQTKMSINHHCQSQSYKSNRPPKTMMSQDLKVSMLLVSHYCTTTRVK